MKIALASAAHICQYVPVLAFLAAAITAHVLPFASVPAPIQGTQIVLSRDIASADLAAPRGSSSSPATAAGASAAQPSQPTGSVPKVPFYSQFTDIQSPAWKKVGCGITDLTMIIDYYHPGAVSVNTMLKKGIAAGAYDYSAGWIYKGLIQLSQPYSLSGTYYDLSKLNVATAFARFQDYLKDGPVILSVHYKFDPRSKIPHLVVVNGIQNGVVYYNDPATTKGTRQISVANFLRGWTRKVIVIRPVKVSPEVALAGK